MPIKSSHAKATFIVSICSTKAFSYCDCHQLRFLKSPVEQMLSLKYSLSDISLSRPLDIRWILSRKIITMFIRHKLKFFVLRVVSISANKLAVSDGYSKLGARGKDFQKLVFSKKEKGL